MNHVLSDMVVRIRNSVRAKQPSVQIMNTKMTRAIASLLVSEGFLQDVSVDDKWVTLSFKYIGKSSCLTDIQIISTPGVRVYTKSKDIPKVLGGLGVSLLSTSQGIVTDKKARSLHIGGELLCSVW
jgi:small subunit ribosomal protein S8